MTRVLDLTESISNIVVGYGVSVAATILILPAFGYDVSGSDAIGISLAFTVVSLARSYLIRRMFRRLSPDRRSISS